jgi:hypothetical protein
MLMLLVCFLSRRPLRRSLAIYNDLPMSATQVSTACPLRIGDGGLQIGRILVLQSAIRIIDVERQRVGMLMRD